MRIAKVLFLTGLGTGLIPFAPGTWGSLLGLFFYLIFYKLPVAFLIYLAVLALGVKLSSSSYMLFGEEDSSKIVIDEVLGMWTALLGLKLSFWLIVIAFLMFRFFDIYKPNFIAFFERLPGGWGVVVDDIVAGVVTNVLLRVMF